MGWLQAYAKGLVYSLIIVTKDEVGIDDIMVEEHKHVQVRVLKFYLLYYSLELVPMDEHSCNMFKQWLKDLI